MVSGCSKPIVMNSNINSFASVMNTTIFLIASFKWPCIPKGIKYEGEIKSLVKKDDF